MKRISARLLPFALALLALLTAGCATDPVTGRRVVNYYSVDDEVRFGRETMDANVDQMRKSGVPINQDRERVQQLEGMVKRIAAVADLPALPYTVTLFQTNIVNAAAAPGGAMMVFSGLYHPKLGLVADEDELAAVMAHEIAHVNCRHVTERLSKVMPLAIGAEVAAQILAHRGNDEIAMGVRAAFAVGTALWIPSYSRQDELEADRVGLMYMAKAGYDPRAAPRIWKRVAEKSGRKDSASIFATHPSDWDRYRALNKRLPAALEAYRQVKGSYPAGYTPP